MTRVQANLILLLAAAIWGGGFVAQSTAMQNIGPYWFVGLRFGIAAIAVLPFALLEARKMKSMPTSKEFSGFGMVGLALLGGAITQQIGLVTTTVTNTSFLTGLYVIFVPVFAVILYRRFPHWIVWPGALMMMGGIFLLSGGTLSKLNTGDMFSIICAVFWALQITLAGKFVTISNRPLALSFTQFATCSILCSLMAVFMEPLSIEAITGAWREIVYVGLVSSGLAFVLQVIGQRYTTAPQAAIFLSTEALFGALFAATLLGETLSGIGYIGCALIFITILLVELVPEFTRQRSAVYTQ